MNNFSIDVLQHCIINKLDFRSMIRFRQVCKWFHRLEIHDFYHIDKKYLMRLSDEILKNYPFIELLNAYNNDKILDVNHLTRLIKLNASNDRIYIRETGGYYECRPNYYHSENCKISDASIKNLNLVELIACGNSLITDVNRMTNLRKLYASYNCGIDDDGIKDTNLTELCIMYNRKITNVDHMPKLKVLCANYDHINAKIGFGLCSKCDF